MSGYDLFRSATLKIERANQHISDLDTAFKAFAGGHKYEIVVHGNVKRGELFFEIIRLDDLPEGLGPVLGDAIHNLRSALDHAMWQLIGLEQGTRNRQLKFPTGDTKGKFEAACKGIMTPEQSTNPFLKSLEIYPSGAGELIYWLGQLDNAEKHTVITPVVNATSVESIEFIDLNTSKRWLSLDVILMPGADGRSFIKCDQGIGINCNHKFKATLGMFFGDVQGVPNQPVLPTLVHFREAVADTLREFRRLVANRDSNLSASERAQIIG